MRSLLLFSLLSASPALAQSIYIDLVPSYNSLACCAQSPLNLAVRTMSFGCGDGGHLTSYSCICTSKSSDLSSLISSLAYKSCNGNGTQASQAVDVFDSYCQVGPSATQAKLTSKCSGSHICGGELLSRCRNYFSCYMHRVFELNHIRETSRLWSFRN